MSTRFPKSRLVLAGVVLLAGAAGTVDAQRPRYGVAVEPEVRQPIIPYPGANVTIDPRTRVAPATHDRRASHAAQRPGAPAVIYVVPVAPGYGDYGFGYAVPSPARGGVYDTNGRPLSSSIGFEAGPSSPPPVASYTPDFSGSPYVVLEGGTMLVDLPSGERRTVPSCAVRDPDGRPRTVFYQGGQAGLLLRAGQRGRVQGTPASGDRACYAADAWGRVVLEY